MARTGGDIVMTTMALWVLLMVFWAVLFFIAIMLSKIANSVHELVKMAHFKVYTEDER
jgi:uncharacterized membrane protein